MRVRRSTARDAEAMAGVLAIVAEEGLIAAEAPVDVAERAEHIRTSLDSEDRPGAWVLETGDAVVGWARTREVVPGVLSLAIAILPEARGHGGGRRLLDTVLAHARDRGAHKVILEVWPDNARAIALYVAAGFTVEGFRRDHYRRRDGSLRSTLLMARHVDG